MQRTVVIDVACLSPHLIGKHTPYLEQWLQQATLKPITPVLPAVTTSAQTTYLTGKHPTEHGIVGNGWYSREDSEVKFWKQSNALIQSDKVWDEARQLDTSGTFTVAKTFWWYNMYANVDYAVTPRPMYPADGRKIPDIHTHPPELRDYLQDKLGQFPLFNFWGPKSDLVSSRWIADACKIIEVDHSPSLQLVYLPHLDYPLQSTGTDADSIAKWLTELDELLKDLLEFFESERNVEVILLSEYGINKVDSQIYINRALRKEGLMTIRNELGKELLDAGASKAFAVADHQIAHIYIKDKSQTSKVIDILNQLNDIELILADEASKEKYNINHERCGDIVCVAKPNAWFVYYYWMDDDKAPDFARCVDIHRKPGYDPVELFVDPDITFPTLKAAWKIAQKELGFRYLMDLIPLDATLPVGSHGHLTKSPEEGAFFASRRSDLIRDKEMIEATEVRQLILQHLGLV